MNYLSTSREASCFTGKACTTSLGGVEAFSSTEDRETLSIRETGVLKDPIMQGLRIENWREAHRAA